MVAIETPNHDDPATVAAAAGAFFLAVCVACTISFVCPRRRRHKTSDDPESANAPDSDNKANNDTQDPDPDSSTNTYDHDSAHSAPGTNAHNNAPDPAPCANAHYPDQGANADGMKSETPEECCNPPNGDKWPEPGKVQPEIIRTIHILMDSVIAAKWHDARISNMKILFDTIVINWEVLSACSTFRNIMHRKLHDFAEHDGWNMALDYYHPILFSGTPIRRDYAVC